ncbi:MAG: PQQ-dependent sugar dehydrogenase [Mesorhizobium sp.]
MRAFSHLAAAAALSLLAGPVAAQSPGQDQQPGQRFEIRPSELPKPFAGKSGRGFSQRVARGERAPRAPDGFTVSLFAEGLAHPRKLFVLDSGDVLLAEQRAGRITLLRDADGNGRAETVQRFARGFSEPFGMGLVPAGKDRGDLLVADAEGIWRMPFGKGKGGVPSAGRRVAVTERGVFGVPGGHSTRSLVADPRDGTLYAGVGSAGNIDEEPEPRATIQAFDADGSGQRTFASGTRNPVGMHLHPSTGRLWTVVQERDGMGNDLVPDYLTEVREGDFYGWPYAYADGKPMPGFAERAPDKVAATKTPKLMFQAHSSAMDFAFVPDSWPKAYRGDAIVALKGSWNRMPPTGYKLVRAKFENGEPAGWYDNFLTGFWVAGTKRAQVWGRPASVAFLPDGGLLVADDTGGTVWKVTPPDPQRTGATD